MSELLIRIPHPAGGRPDMAALGAALDRVASAAVSQPFSSERCEAVAEISRRLSRMPDRRPEVQALAFWMRRTAIERMRHDFTAVNADPGGRRVISVPRGTVLHLPPRNVDTMFAYSWVLAILTGNRNIIRLSPQATEQTRHILDTVLDALAGFPGIAGGTLVVEFDRDQTVLHQLSAACDIRVIWGGDTTVNTIREIPLPPLARDLAFPDRRSLAAIRTAAYATLTLDEHEALAEQFFNDAYWFDQLGCSSPRVVAWIGEEDPAPHAQAFFERLERVVHAKGYAPDASVAMRKLAGAMTFMAGAPGTRLHWMSNAVAVMDVQGSDTEGAAFVGAGTFESVRLNELADLSGITARRDQTLSVFGFTDAELAAFVESNLGRGIDRIVPIGRALAFDRIWDGIDLLTEFTRKTTIDLRDALP